MQSLCQWLVGEPCPQALEACVGASGAMELFSGPWTVCMDTYRNRDANPQAPRIQALVVIVADGAGLSSGPRMHVGLGGMGSSFRPWTAYVGTGSNSGSGKQGDLVFRLPYGSHRHCPWWVGQAGFQDLG